MADTPLPHPAPDLQIRGIPSVRCTLFPVITFCDLAAEDGSTLPQLHGTRPHSTLLLATVGAYDSGS